MPTTWLGVVLAIGASFSNNFGIVLQKKVVNTVPADARESGFFRTLGRHPLWLLGILMQVGLPSAFLLYAQYHIGPTLVPGLQGIGLIVLVIGSTRINHETLSPLDYFAILFLIVATGLTAFSGLDIHVGEFDFQQVWFFRNALFFSAIVFLFILIQEVLARKSSPYLQSILFSMISGFLYALSDFWTSPLVGTIGEVFGLRANWTQWALFVLASILLVYVNIVAIGKTQLAFKHGPASILIPLRHIPTLTLPVFVYYFVYQVGTQKGYSLWFYLAAVALILVSSVILGRHEERFAQAEVAGEPGN